jgi:hypothetical protein
VSEPEPDAPIEVRPERARLRRARLTGLVPLVAATGLVLLAPRPVTWVLFVLAGVLATVWLRGAGPVPRVDVGPATLVVLRGGRERVRAHRLETDATYVGEQGIGATLRVVGSSGGSFRIGLPGLVPDELLEVLVAQGWPATRAPDPRVRDD